MNSVRRFSLVALLVASAAILLYSRSRVENVPLHESLSSFPKTVGDWTGRDIVIPAGIHEVLGPGDYLLRIYENEKLQSDINLFVAYIPSQRAGDTLHSPQNCLPGAGWSPLEAGKIMIALPDRSPFSVNRFLIGKNGDRQLVFYWYAAHGRNVASEYWAKFYLITDSIRLNRSDGSLIRIITPVPENESTASAEQHLLNFSATIVPVLDRYISQ